MSSYIIESTSLALGITITIIIIRSFWNKEILFPVTATATAAMTVAAAVADFYFLGTPQKLKDKEKMLSLLILKRVNFHFLFYLPPLFNTSIFLFCRSLFEVYIVDSVTHISSKCSFLCKSIELSFHE